MAERIPAYGLQAVGEQGRRRSLEEERRQLMVERAVVFEREAFGVRLEKEVERIEHGHLGHQGHVHLKEFRRLRKYQARQEVRLRVLLPIDEMLVWTRA